ncbi:MAG: ABC transporter substrate-binding protein [Proteobacteria bacterium]|nr:ABC transporter substrate-binding protein [Pseudomonadota bacterium]
MFQAFRARLRDLGYVDGRNLEIRFHSSGGAGYSAEGADRLASLARAIAAAGADVVLADGRPATQAMLAASRTIPIVGITGADPTLLDLATSLARPGGNVTGITFFTVEVGAKQLEILREIAPAMRRAGIVSANAPFDRAIRAVTEAGAALGIDTRHIQVDTPQAIASALAPAALTDVEGLVVLSNAVLAAAPNTVVTPINLARKPAVYHERDFVDAGGLACYGVNFADVFRRLADYVDRVLRGGNPAEMPIERPTIFELVINLKTARTLGLQIPPTLLARADEVIE